jgi:hypothetical protein
MVSKIISFLKGICISLITLIILFLLFEFIVFRFILKASDFPKIGFQHGVVKYIPNQRGVYRIKNEIKAQYRINSAGWNSYHKDYELETSKYRIAIIGDSYVAAFSVDYNQSLAEQLEEKLGADSYQVYRFGICGAPLSQYLHILRKEVIYYAPDLVIFVLIHNDFEESYKFKQGVYTSSFLKLKIKDSTVVSEIEPTHFRQHWYSWLRNTSTWRYLAYRQRVKFTFLRNIILGKEKTKKEYQANIPISSLQENWSNNIIITDYVLSKSKETCEEIGAEFLIIIDGDRNSIYKMLESDELYKTGVLRLNSLVDSISKKYEVHFIDLHPIFMEDFSNCGKPFNAKIEGHWNQYAHGLVASTVYEYLKTQINP